MSFLSSPILTNPLSEEPGEAAPHRSRCVTSADALRKTLIGLSLRTALTVGLCMVQAPLVWTPRCFGQPLEPVALQPSEFGPVALQPSEFEPSKAGTGKLRGLRVVSVALDSVQLRQQDKSWASQEIIELATDQAAKTGVPPNRGTNR